MSIIKTVLVYIERDNQYLLIHKQKNDMNYGKYLGVGGKIEPNESIEAAAIRETYEETGLTIQEPELRGKIYFHSGTYEEWMYLFTVSTFTCDLVPSSEGALVWVDQKAMKNLPMWAGDHHFLERLQTDQNYFELHLVYEDDTLIKVY